MLSVTIIFQARKAKAKAQAAAEQSLMEDIKESQRVEDVRASIPQDDDYG